MQHEERETGKVGFQVVTLTAHSIPLPDHVGWTIRATLSGRPQGGAAAGSRK